MSIINEQIQLILEDLALIEDPYQRADIRTKLISCIAESNLEVSVEEPVGKDAIKNDIKKEQDAPIEFEVKEEVVEESAKEVKEEEAKEEPKKKKATKSKSIASKSKKGPKEIDLEEPKREKKIVTVEDEDGTTEVDVTDAYYKIAPQMQKDGVDEETILLTAQYLVCNALMPIYETLDGLKDSYNKMMLAYYMQEYGVDAINESVIAEISDGTITDLYEFVNDSNLDFTLESIESATESDDEE